MSMADEEEITGGNGAGELGDQPEVVAIAQYIKDLSVESPNAPQSFQWQAQPQLDVQFNIGVGKIADDVHEVVLKFVVTARSDEGVQFVIDLSYAGLYGLRNIPEEALPPFLLIEAPRLQFPFVRQIIADASQNTGFPPLLLDPVDFGAAYVAQLQAQQGEAGGNGANGGSAPAGEAEPAETADETPQG